MSIESVSGESVNDSTISLTPVNEATEALKDENTHNPTPRMSRDTMRKFSAEQPPNFVGLLPPWAQTKVEKEAIQKDPRLKDFIGEEKIIEIIKTEKGYVVITEKHQLDVAVNYIPRGYPGPAKFELEFGKCSER